MLSHPSGRFQAHSLTPSATNRGLKVKQVVGVIQVSKITLGFVHVT